MARPFTKPVWSGATFGVIVWGLSHLETCAPDAHDIRFSIAEMVNPYLRYAKKKPAVGPAAEILATLQASCINTDVPRLHSNHENHE